MLHGNVGQSDLTREDMIRYEWGITDSGIYHSSVYDKGKLVGTIGLKSFDREELNPQCYDDFEWVLREIEWESNRSIQDGQIDKWVVFDVGLDEPYRNKGIGHKMYENIFKIKNNKPHTIIVGYKCETGGTTSYDAEMVYERLQRKYIGKGLVVSSIKKDSDEFSADNIYIGETVSEPINTKSGQEIKKYITSIHDEYFLWPDSWDDLEFTLQTLPMTIFEDYCDEDSGDCTKMVRDAFDTGLTFYFQKLPYMSHKLEDTLNEFETVGDGYPPVVLKLNKDGKYETIDGFHRLNALQILEYDTVDAWVGSGQFIKRADNIHIGDEYGGFVKSNPNAVNLPGVVEFPGEQERIESFMPLEDYENLPHGDVNLILSKLPYPTEGFTEEEIEQQHESIISTIVSHEYIHKSIDEEVLAWANENKLEKGDYYAAHEIMAYVDMAHRETSSMAGFKARLFQLVGSHPIITDNPELADRILDAMIRSRKGLKFQVPAEIKTIMQAFELAGFEILVVGGAVRDAIMGLTPKDYDLATNALPNEVNEVIAQIAGYRVVSTPEAQLARGVLTSLVLPPSGEVIEITTFRAELGYEEGTRRPIAVPAETFKEDSERRDFTMNALGWKLNGTILDYHDGLDDLEFGYLVSVGDANDRIKEDPLRILRAIRFHSRYGLDLDEDLSEAIGTHLKLLLTLSAERVRKELDSILKSEEGIYDLVNVGIVETLIPEYQGGYWGERNYDDGDSEFSFIADIQRYSMVDQSYPPQVNYTPRPWQPSIVYALLFKNVVTKEEFNERYRRGPIAFSRAEADMIAELIELYPLLISEDDEVVSSPSNIVRIVTSPYYAELMAMADTMNESWLANYLAPYRQRYKGKPPKGYAMKVADAYSIEPSPALGDKISEITEAIILGDIEDWDEGLNYYAAEGIIDYSKRGICDIVALAETKKLLSQGIDDFLVVEGYVWTKDAEAYEWDYPDAHTWIKLKDGTIIDPSEKQYEDEGGIVERYDTFAYDQLNDFYKESKWYTPNEYLSLWGELIQTAEEVGTRERIAYAGVILDEATSEQLLARFESEIPEDWTRDAHHMTVSLGKSIPNQADLGKEVTLTVTAVGKSDDAVAVAVSGYPSRNALPHITLAIPPGGKPFNSNKITDWQPIEPFEIQGKLRDVKTYVAETFRGEAGPSYLFGSYHYDHSLQDLYEQFEMYYGPDNRYGLIDASPGYEEGPAGGSGLWAIIDAFGNGVLREVPVPKRDWITNFFGEITIPEMNYILKNWDDLAFNFGLDEELSYKLVDRYVNDFSEYHWPKNGLKGLLWTREFQDSDKVTLEEYTSGIRRIELLERPVQSLNYPSKSTVFMAENNPSRLDIFYDWVEVDKKEIFNIPATEYNDRFDIANVVIAYQGTIKEKFLGDLPSVVYFYIWKDIFDETDLQSWYQLHSANSGWECRCFECLQEGGPLFINSQTGIYEKQYVTELIAESVRQGVPYQSWFQDSRVSKLVRTLSIPVTGMKITAPQVTEIQSYLEPDFYSGEGFWTSLLSSYYYSSKANQNLRKLEERLAKNRMVTLNYPRSTWRGD